VGRLDLKKKALVLLTLFLICSITGFTAFAAGQDSGTSLIALSSTQTTFYGELGTSPEARNLNIIGLEDGVNVTLIPSDPDLYSNGTGKSIPVNFENLDEPHFVLDKNDPKTVTLTIESPEKVGTYSGTITVTATNVKGNITTTNLTVVATIAAVNPWINPLQWGSVVLIAVLILWGLLTSDDKRIPKKDRKIGLCIRGHCLSIKGHNLQIEIRKEQFIYKKVLVVSLGIIVSIIWLALLVNFSFGGPSTVFNALLITPFVAYAVAIVKDLRTERLDKEKTSRTIRDDGIKKDIDLIRNLIGEMSTHCASFRPNFYEEKLEKPFDDNEHLLYNDTGLIYRKVWDESTKQGFVADIHTLHLEKYYDIIPLYTKCYSYAMSIVEKPENERKTEEENFLNNFENFRKVYGDLQEIIFVYLSYILECYSKTALSPIKIEIPRITRTLLYKLIEYEILKSFDFLLPDSLSRFKTQDLVEALKPNRLEQELMNLEKRASASNTTPETLQKLNAKMKIIKKLIDVLKKPGVNSEKLLEEAKQQFEEKKDLKDRFKKDRPDLIGNPEKSHKEFKIYAFKNIGEVAWKDEFKEGHKDLKEGTKEFKEKFDVFLQQKVTAFRDTFIKNAQLKEEFKENLLKKEFKNGKPDLDEGEGFKEQFTSFKTERIEKLKTEFKAKNPDLSESAAEFNDAFNTYIEDKPDFKQKFDEYVDDHMIEGTHFEELEAVEKWVTMRFKEKIEWWELTADDLDKIVDYIYAKDAIPHFFRHMQDDFQKTYLKLKDSIKKIDLKDVPAMQKDTDITEYKVSLGNIYKKDDANKPDNTAEKRKPEPLRLDIQGKTPTSDK
jgi:hypothetical protein